MDPSLEIAALHEDMIASIAGSVGVGLIASFLELTSFFTLSSCMFLMLSIPPLLQWILCDEPPLAKRDELLTYVTPCVCFMISYAVPGIMARIVSMVAYVWGIVIWHLSVFWIFHTGFALTLLFNPEHVREFFLRCVGLLGGVIYYTLIGIRKCWEIASDLHDMVVSAQKRLMEARKPKGRFTYGEPKIRLLKLSRRNPISEITCRLREFPLDETPPYEAISYRWDDDKERKDIIVNDRRFSLSPRVYDVLKERSSLFRSRWIWIDAICIDQSSEKDKTEQVRLMGDIYRNASRTIVWLGSAKLSQYEIRTTLNLLNMVSFAKVGMLISFERLRKDFMEKNRPGVGTGRWRGLNNLLRHKWFGRVWMVQEVVVAKKVHAVYGGTYLDWDQFSDAISGLSTAEMSAVVWSAGETSKIGQTGAPLAISHTAVIATLRQKYSKGEAITLKDGLLACSRFEASLAMDKIYSLQGFITEEIGERLKADYVRDSHLEQSVEDLYTNTAEFLINKDYVADILSLAGIGHARKLDKLPSWAVDWSDIPELVQFSGGKDVCVYRASGDSTSSIDLTTSRGRITLRGFEVDAISELGPKLLHDSKFEEKPSEHVDSIRRIFKFYHEAEALSKSSMIGRTREDSFWRTLIGDRVWVNGRRSQEPAPDECAAWNHSFQVTSQIAKSPVFDLVLKSGDPWERPSYSEQILLNSKITLALRPLGLTHDDFTRNLMEVFKFLPSKGAACTNRMFCTTMKGSIAIVPPLTEENDMVFIPLGSQTPFVIRKHGTEEDVARGKTRAIFKLVGECYVYGMMDGEMMDDSVGIEDFILE